jgi:pimeloyl-ACP methyl ester carboxylesterase
MPNAPRFDSVQCLSPAGLHRMAYTEWGDPTNPRVLICVHGLTRVGRDFDRLARALIGQYRVVCPDVVGRGRSDWLREPKFYGVPQYVADMVTLIARLNAQSVHWVGTSMGGLIGMMLAAQPNNPVHKLVINDVGPLVPKAALQRLAGYVGKAPPMRSVDELEHYFRQVFAGFGTLTPEQWRHMATASARHNDDGTIAPAYDPAIANAFSGELQDVVLWPVWDAVRCPTLLLRGADSDLLLAETAREMTQRGPKPKLKVFEGCGHAPALMAKDQIEVVRDFLLAP